jgi:hypothetical protein
VSSSNEVVAGQPFVSQVYDAGLAAAWTAVSWTANPPIGATLVVQVSTGETPTPDATWSAWTAVGNGQEISISSMPLHTRYLRYRVVLLSANGVTTPIPFQLSLTSSPTFTDA